MVDLLSHGALRSETAKNICLEQGKGCDISNIICLIIPVIPKWILLHQDSGSYHNRHRFLRVKLITLPQDIFIR